MTTAPQKLRAWIDAHDLKDAEVARRLGVSKASVSEWLSSKTVPEYPNALKISKLTRRAVRPSDWTAEYAAG